MQIQEIPASFGLQGCFSFMRISTIINQLEDWDCKVFYHLADLIHQPQEEVHGVV